jgi:hypothetical protein
MGATGSGDTFSKKASKAKLNALKEQEISIAKLLEEAKRLHASNESSKPKINSLNNPQPK